MYTIQDLFDNPGDYILCETLEDVELFRNACEQSGYAEDAFRDIIRLARNYISSGRNYMIRSDFMGFLGEFNGLVESSRDNFRGYGGGFSHLYKNCIRTKELCIPGFNETSFNPDLFNQMLGVS